MFDLHSHILPGIDDGSADAQMSIDMIRASLDQGVEGIALTPHFYADRNTPERFLQKRQDAARRLAERIEELDRCPALTLGAEVHFYRGISRTSELENLCYGSSRYILIEMPFSEWTPSTVTEIGNIGPNLGLTPVIAHVGRYLGQKKAYLKELFEMEDILIQSNSEFFLERKTTHKALKMLKEGKIDILGSDCHNITDRRQDLGEAVSLIQNKLGEPAVSKLRRNGERIFRAAGAIK